MKRERCRRCGKKIPDDDGVSEIPSIGGKLAWFHRRCLMKVKQRRADEGRRDPSQ